MEGNPVTHQAFSTQDRTFMSRRALIKAAAAAMASLVGAAAMAPGIAIAADPPGQASPPTVITNPPRQFGPDAPPNQYPDPDVLAIDPQFGKYSVFNSPIQRLWTGALWAEGPAWSSEGRYLLWSDVGGNVQYRWLQDDGHVTAMRTPSNNSNGNTFDFQGRQLSCQDFFRRVVRWELDGSMTVIADSFNGKKLNSPNDIVPHPDGSIWFTDPPYGDSLFEGQPDTGGKVNPAIGAPDGGGLTRQLPNSIYRVDKSGRIDLVTDEVEDPNGLCFSPDYKTLYVCNTGAGPGDTKGGPGNILAYDVSGDNKVAGRRVFTDMMVDGVHCGPDGLRADVDGNLWCSSNGPLGYSGVLVYTPQGKLIGRIRLPEVCANLSFGGLKRNRLFMTASASLYAVYVNTQGAAPG